MTFLYSTLSGPENVPAQDASELLGIARELPRWDTLIVVAENEQYPRLHVTWHEGHGFVIQSFQDGASWGFFLARTTSFSSPEIEIEMGGQALEKWPRQLFVDADRALEALDFFLKTGKQDGTQHWVGTDGSPREIVWERGRVARRGKRGSNHDDGLAFRFARWSGSKRPSATRECRRRTRNCSDVGRPCPRP